MKSGLPTKRHPLLKGGVNPLDFGDFLNATELTSDQKVTAFISKYMDVVDPVGRYAKYFESSAKSVDHILRDVKLYYRKLVVEGSWAEKKYVAVVNDIFENRAALILPVIDGGGLRYDKGMLASQRRMKRVEGGRRR